MRPPVCGGGHFEEGEYSTMRFEKVSLLAFAADMKSEYPLFTNDYITRAWNGIVLPKRSTKHSAGYDICTPIRMIIPPDCRAIIPTGIKAVFEPDEMDTWHLQMYVRSSVGIKQGVVLTNGTGIIDPDYQFAENEGDMMLALINTSDQIVKYEAGDRICQAIFCIHGITSDDEAGGCRHGGVGSTGV